MTFYSPTFSEDQKSVDLGTLADILETVSVVRPSLYPISNWDHLVHNYLEQQQQLASSSTNNSANKSTDHTRIANSQPIPTATSQDEQNIAFKYIDSIIETTPSTATFCRNTISRHSIHVNALMNLASKACGYEFSSTLKHQATFTTFLKRFDAETVLWMEKNVNAIFHDKVRQTLLTACSDFYTKPTVLTIINEYCEVEPFQLAFRAAHPKHYNARQTERTTQYQQMLAKQRALQQFWEDPLSRYAEMAQTKTLSDQHRIAIEILDELTKKQIMESALILTPNSEYLQRKEFWGYQNLIKLNEVVKLACTLRKEPTSAPNQLAFTSTSASSSSCSYSTSSSSSNVTTSLSQVSSPRLSPASSSSNASSSILLHTPPILNATRSYTLALGCQDKERELKVIHKFIRQCSLPLIETLYTYLSIPEKDQFPWASSADAYGRQIPLNNPAAEVFYEAWTPICEEAQRKSMVLEASTVANTNSSSLITTRLLSEEKMDTAALTPNKKLGTTQHKRRVRVAVILDPPQRTLNTTSSYSLSQEIKTEANTPLNCLSANTFIAKITKILPKDGSANQLARAAKMLYGWPFSFTDQSTSSTASHTFAQ